MSSKFRRSRVIALAVCLVIAMVVSISIATADMTKLNVPVYKPLLTGKEWVAVGGMPIAATVGAKIFIAGGNAVDAACAMLGASAVMTDGMHWGGETQALIYDPNRNKVFGINAMGVAPTGMTPEFFLDQGMAFPPNRGVHSGATPGTPGGLMLMLAEFGTMSLAQVLEPVIDLADGYVVTGYRGETLFREGNVEQFKEWKYSKDVFLPGGQPLEFGKIFVQRDLANTLRKLVATEKEALAAGKSRKEAIMAAFDRFYKGDIAVEIARGMQDGGGLHTYEDLANWKPYIEEPVMTTYHGIEVYKLTTWTQGPVLLQMLNLLEGFDLEAMGHNSVEYIHTLYQVMNLAYADRDFYYGDPYFPPEEPIEGLLSKAYANDRRKLINPNRNDPGIGPGDPYPYQDGVNPFLDLAKAKWGTEKTAALPFVASDWIGNTTSVNTLDITGWMVAITPSGGWAPSYIAGRTGVGMGTRLQQFVLDPKLNPYNVIEPGKRPRVTLTPSMALKDGHPFMSFSKRGGDVQDQHLLQLFLNVVHFGMNIQEATEAAKITSNQMESSFGTHSKYPGRLTLDTRIPQEVFDELKTKGYDVRWANPSRYYNPGGENPGNLGAVLFDWEHQTLQGGASISGERYGISW